MAFNDETYILKKKKNTFVYWAFFGLIGFLVIYFPLYGTALRYQTGSLFNGTLDSIFGFIGPIITTFGGYMLIFGFFSLICGKRMGGVKVMLVGVIFLYIGGFCVGTNYMAYFTGGATEVPQGYN